MSGQELRAIDKLDDENYAVMSVQIKSVLVHSSMWWLVCEGRVKQETDLVVQRTQFDELNEWILLITELVPKKIGTSLQLCTSPFRKVRDYKISYLNGFTGIIEKLNKIGMDISEDILTISSENRRDKA